MHGGDPHVICISTLNSWYSFVNTFANARIRTVDLSPAGSYVVVRPSDLSSLISRFHFFTLSDLQSIASAHNLGQYGHRPKSAIQRDLLVHKCGTSCVDMLMVFKALYRERRRVRHTTSVVTREIASAKVEHELNAKAGRERRAKSNKKAKLSEETRKEERSVRDGFPVIAGEEIRHRVISEWQLREQALSEPSMYCAVCRYAVPTSKCHTVDPHEVDFTLLQNAHLPVDTLPSNYNLEAYSNAILYHKGLHSTTSLGPVDMCSSCKHALVGQKKQPLDSLANFQYYAHGELPDKVRQGFQQASMYDLMLIARSRTTRITHLFSSKQGSSLSGDPSVSQRYNRGNVAILPQDSVHLRDVLPPSADEISEAMCTLFVGGDTKPTVSNIANLGPVLVSKGVVKTLIDFLLGNNPWYVDSGVSFSLDNFNALFDKLHDGVDRAPLTAVSICHLPSDQAQGVDGGTADYTDRYTFDDDASDLVMEAVGYVNGDHSPQNHDIMKASALAWCLDRKQFIKMQSGSQLLSDRDPGLLTFVFPHLDPWGIGGFYERRRSKAQYISFERQVRNLLMQDESPFRADPNFAYVCWNILQKREVNRNTSFRVSQSVQSDIVKELTEIGPSLSSLIEKWTANPNAKPSNSQEKRAIKVLARLRLIAKDLKGSSGYKQCRRNEIRALIKKYSTPALFMTLNPSDLTHPLVGKFGGVPVDVWREMSSSERARFVARNPGAAALFFDEMMSAFIDTILRYGKKEGGLFGHCEAYYGMVEAQGRGTLHCHILIWLKGSLSPQDLRDKMASDSAFCKRMISWVESIVSCELMGMTEVLNESSGPLKKPDRLPGERDPRLCERPLTTGVDDVDFQIRFSGPCYWFSIDQSDSLCQLCLLVHSKFPPEVPYTYTLAFANRMYHYLLPSRLDSVTPGFLEG